MATIAVYNLKGGVGKTSLAVNLAWCAATLSSRRTLLWDLDPQAAASFILGGDEPAREQAQAVFARDVPPSRLVRPTAVERLDLLPADKSLRGLDRFFFGLGKKRRLSKLIDDAARDYDRVVLDCPPGLGETSEQAMRAADLVIVPVIPSPLSRRAFDEVVAHFDGAARRPTLLPLFSMVDRRRATHRAALAADPGWPAIPMASAIEAMSSRHAAVGAFDPSGAAARAVAELWVAIERRLNT